MTTKKELIEQYNKMHRTYVFGSEQEFIEEIKKLGQMINELEI